MTATGDVTRRLAAILAADVAGYSRLMAADEAGTLARLNRFRADVIEPKIVQFKGRIVGSAGDSLLVEFASAVDAVQCAFEVQERLAERNDELAAAQRMVFRMGVNLGDVIAEAGTIHGDGVNVAARLEKLAEPGSLVVARNVYDQVKGKLPYEFAYLGEQSVHNIPEPVRAYRVAPATARAGASGPDPATRPTGSPFDKPALAVLPFTNMSGDPEQEYFSDGITEDIITELSRNDGLVVIARNSSFHYKGRPVKVQEVGHELGVAYVVEGSVRKAGNRIRVTAQLVEAETGAHVWAERYDRSLDDIFAVQDEIVDSVVTSLDLSLHKVALAQSHARPVESLTAYDHLLRGRAAFIRGGLREVFEQMTNAVAVDSRCARALAWLALLYAYDRFSGTKELSDDEATRHASEHAELALAIDDRNMEVQACVGGAYALLGDPERGRRHSDVAVALNPHDINVIRWHAVALSYCGDHAGALGWLERARQLDPVNSTAHAEMVFDARYMMRDYDGAIAAYRDRREPAMHMFVEIAAAHAQAGRAEEAARAMAEFERRRPANYDAAAVVRWHAKMCARPEDRDHWLEGYRKAGVAV